MVPFPIAMGFLMLLAVFLAIAFLLMVLFMVSAICAFFRRAALALYAGGSAIASVGAVAAVSDCNVDTMGGAVSSRSSGALAAASCRCDGAMTAAMAAVMATAMPMSHHRHGGRAAKQHKGRHHNKG